MEPASDGTSPHPDALRAIYSEAGHWLRLVNAIAWTTAALLVPTSVACVGLALAHPCHRVALTCASLGALGLWIWIMRPYAWSAKKARETLISIEADWRADGVYALYTTQRDGRPGRAALKFQIAITVFVAFAWAYVYFVR